MSGIFLFLDQSGNLCAEAPGKNGMRKKIDLPEGMELTVLRSELLSQYDAERERAKRLKEKEDAENKARSNRVFKTIAMEHDIPFARKVMPYKKPGKLLIAKSWTYQNGSPKEQRDTKGRPIRELKI